MKNPFASFDIEVLRRPRFSVCVEPIHLYDSDRGVFTNKWFGVFIQIGWRAVMICWK